MRKFPSSLEGKELVLRSGRQILGKEEENFLVAAKKILRKGGRKRCLKKVLRKYQEKAR